MRLYPFEVFLMIHLRSGITNNLDIFRKKLIAELGILLEDIQEYLVHLPGRIELDTIRTVSTYLASCQ